MMNITPTISYIVVLYFGGSAHRYLVDAANEADALETALIEYAEDRADQPHAVLRLHDFTVERQ